MMKHWNKRLRIAVATVVVVSGLSFSATALALELDPAPLPQENPFSGTRVEGLLSGSVFSSPAQAGPEESTPAAEPGQGTPAGPQAEPEQEGPVVTQVQPEQDKPTGPQVQPEQEKSAETGPASLPVPDAAPPDEVQQPKAPPEAQPPAQPTVQKPAATKPPAAKAHPPALLKEARDAEKAEDHATALAKYSLTLKAAEARSDPKTIAPAVDGLARAAFRLGRDEEALGYLRRAIKLHQEQKNARARSLAYALAGRIFMRQSNWTAAAASFDEALKILPVSEAALAPDLLENLASCRVKLNRHKEAVNAYGRLAAILSKEGKDKDAARVLLLMGDAQVARSDARAARASYGKAEEIFRKLGAKDQLAETVLRLTKLDETEGKRGQAAVDSEESRSVAPSAPKKPSRDPQLLAKGMKARRNGDVLLAVRTLTEALNQYREAGDRLMSARARLALGNVENDRSRMKSALEHGGEALHEFRALSDHAGEAGALVLVGSVYYKQGFMQKAQEYAQESLAVAKKANDKTAAARARVLLSQIHTNLGEADFAWKLLKEAVEEVSGGPDGNARAIVRLAVARFQFARESLDNALKTAQAARKDFTDSGDLTGAADSDQLMALVHEQRGESKKAQALLERSLESHRATWDRFGEGGDLVALGIHYKHMGEHEKALNHFAAALDVRRRIGDRRGEAAALSNMGNLMKHRGQVPEAVQNLEQALAIYRDLGDKKGEADVLTNLANAQGSGRSQAAALEKLTAALELHRKINDLRGVATDLAIIGRFYLERGELDNAAKSLDEAEKINKRIYNPRGEVALLAENAMLAKAKRDPQAALVLLQKALKLAQSIGDAAGVSSIRLKMASVLQDAGRHDQALALLKDTIEIMRRQGDRRGELWALGEMGVIQVKTEDYENALASLHRALQLRSELGLAASQTRDLDFYLGEIYDGFKDYERALDHYHKALDLAQLSASNSVLGRIYHRIGNIYYQIEEYEKAREFYEDALRVHGETKNIPMQRTELIRLGDIFSKLSKPDEALRYQLRALALAKETGDPRGEPRILTRIGTLYQVLGRPRIALDYYREAQEKRSQLGDRRGVNENLLQIALVKSILGDFDGAVAGLKSAFEIAHAADDRGMLWKAYFIMGRSLQGKGQTGEALESYRKAIAVLEAMETDIVEESDEDAFIFGGKTALFETTLNVLMKLARKDPGGAYESQALRIVERLKAATFDNMLARTNVPGFADLPQDLLIKEKSLRLGLRKVNERLSTELSRENPNQGHIEKLAEERRVREKAFQQLKVILEKDYPAYAAVKYPRLPSVQQLQKEVVDPDEAILEYMVTRSRTYIFAIDKARFNTFSIDYSLKDLERDVDALMRPLHRADTRESWDPSVAYRIYSRVIKPVEHFLAGKKAVVVIPHGPLSTLPFEILVCSAEHAEKRFWSVKERPTYLVEKHAFCYAPTASLLSYLRTRKRPANPGWSMVAFGDAVYTDKGVKAELNPGAERLLTAFGEQSKGTRDQSLQPLPGARREISEIAKIVGGPVQAYFGAEATETLFKKADLSRYGYIHLATHGLLLTPVGKLWQQPAIVFSLYGDTENDGFLQLGEVYGLKLHADLVVLSSCLSPGAGSSGVYNGLLGLSQSFLVAGADSVILSMWQVNDESTAKLFIEMYRKLKEKSKAEALRQAKLALIADKSTSHPYYWGPFVLMGKWHVSLPPGFNKPDPEKVRFKGLSVWRRLFSL